MPNGEWVREGVGVVLGVLDRLWFAYPVGDSGRLGPFRSREAAARAVEDGAASGGVAQIEPLLFGGRSQQL
jgi:hypothetical protein